ncbi:hypothetical protein ABLG96_19950 [Nakamurella sp. A5-74]|uniref:Uncharacterized protein n=1 Tax=Nakamurella sp. A5-74 TaxID=3158264 RepID=A0AAU8DYS9_9ACTN
MAGIVSVVGSDSGRMGPFTDTSGVTLVLGAVVVDAAGFEVLDAGALVLGFVVADAEVEGCDVEGSDAAVGSVEDALEGVPLSSTEVLIALDVGALAAVPASPSITPALADVGESGGVALLQEPRTSSRAPRAASTPLAHNRMRIRRRRSGGARRAFIGESPSVGAGPAACCPGTGLREVGMVGPAHRATPGGSVETDPPGELRHGTNELSEPAVPDFRNYY